MNPNREKDDDNPNGERKHNSFINVCKDNDQQKATETQGYMYTLGNKSLTRNRCG